MSLIGTAISVGGSLLGGILGNNSQAKANKANIAFQREMGQNSIQWRVADANKAGVHPLYALGAPTMSASPSSVGYDWGPALSNAGQDISRAIDARNTKKERAKLTALEHENMILQNHKLRSEIHVNEQAALSEQARRNLTQVGPPEPRIGASEWASLGGDAGVVDYQPATPIVGSKDNRAREPGEITDYGFIRNDHGGLTVAPSKDAKDRTEDDIIQQIAWATRNQILPAFTGLSPPKIPTPISGAKWKWSTITQSFMPYKNGRWYYREKNGKWMRSKYPRGDK